MSLPQLNYENMAIAYEKSGNITENPKYQAAMDSKVLRSLAFQASFYLNSYELNIFFLDKIRIRPIFNGIPIYRLAFIATKHSMCANIAMKTSNAVNISFQFTVSMVYAFLSMLVTLMK